MNKARITKIRVEGVLCSPNPVLRNENTIANLVEQVIVSIIAGNRDIAVSKNANWIILEDAEPFPSSKMFGNPAV